VAVKKKEIMSTRNIMAYRTAMTSLAVISIFMTIPASARMPQAATTNVTGVAAAGDPFPYDSDAERQLFDLANRARAQAGVSPLQIEEGLTRAARMHAAEMAAQQQLSHQLSNEPSLVQRLATNSTLHLEGTGENVALCANVDHVQDKLMQSTPHRENLLNPAYNVAGFGVVRRGDMLYVAQDFGYGMRIYSTAQAEQAVAGSVAQVRSEANLGQLRRVDDSAAQAAACSMAQADSLTTPTPRGLYLLHYTTTQLEALPTGAARLIGDHGLHDFSAGTCYARTAAYPSGTYWVVLILN
jgi:uncharacterized protein YkwD